LHGNGSVPAACRGDGRAAALRPELIVPGYGSRPTTPHLTATIAEAVSAIREEDRSKFRAMLEPGYEADPPELAELIRERLREIQLESYRRSHGLD
jgi:hypothetical protein